MVEKKTSQQPLEKAQVSEQDLQPLTGSKISFPLLCLQTPNPNLGQPQRPKSSWYQNSEEFYCLGAFQFWLFNIVIYGFRIVVLVGWSTDFLPLVVEVITLFQTKEKI